MNLSHLTLIENHLDRQLSLASKVSQSKNPCISFITWASDLLEHRPYALHKNQNVILKGHFQFHQKLRLKKLRLQIAKQACAPHFADKGAWCREWSQSGSGMLYLKSKKEPPLSSVGADGSISRAGAIQASFSTPKSVSMEQTRSAVNIT